MNVHQFTKGNNADLAAQSTCLHFAVSPGRLVLSSFVGRQGYIVNSWFKRDEEMCNKARNRMVRVEGEDARGRLAVVVGGICSYWETVGSRRCDTKLASPPCKPETRSFRPPLQSTYTNWTLAWTLITLSRYIEDYVGRLLALLWYQMPTKRLAASMTFSSGSHE